MYLPDAPVHQVQLYGFCPWLTAALSLAQVIIITGGKCYFELVKSDHKRGGITFEAAKANGFQEQDASDNVDSAFI